MPAEIIKSTIDSILRDFSLCSHELGGLEFYGYSAEFRDLLSLCRDFATDVEPGTQTSRKAYVFLDNAHGKTSLSRAIAIHRETGGGKAFRFDGTVGSTSKDVKDLQHNTDALVVIDDLPEASDPRSKLLERLNSLTGRAIVFARPEYATDAHLRPDTPCLKLDHVDYRQIDKIAWLIGLVREQLRDEGGFLSPVLAAALANLPAGLLSTLSSVRLGLKIANLPLLAVRIAEAVRINVVLQDGRSIQENELAAIFADFCSSGSDPMDTRFRLWVEGESDSRILKLACQLARPIHGLDLEEGLAIIPLGLGRDGGTSKATEVVIRERTRRNKDIFLLDSDSPGRHAEQELKTLDQEVLFLDSKIACSRVEPEVEIEDFLSLGCLDRFYLAHPDLRPEKEVIKYKPPASRRLVVDGAHKEELVSWLERNAAVEELENVILILCEVRSRFSLKSPPAMKEKRRQLIDETRPAKHFGTRPSHWTL